MLHPWKKTASEYLVSDEWLRLRADTCERQDGHVIAPFYVMEERDFVHALPVLPDGRIVLVRQYRHAAQIFCLELPGGLLDPTESPLAGAQREAREECGLTGGEWSELATFYPNPARQTNRFHCFLAWNVEPTLATAFDANEEIEQHYLTVAEVDTAIANGTFSQSSHIASFLLAKPRLKNHEK
jgi:8-oxo-dGTP pyrophosphatase MutT (NUDIX family)